MKTLILSIVAGLAAGPLMAGGLAFEPVAPVGLDAAAEARVEKLQAAFPGQLAAFEQAGYGAWGALAVPVGVELTPQMLASAANLASAEEAEAKTLEVCKAQTGHECTVIGLLVPGD